MRKHHFLPIVALMAAFPVFADTPLTENFDNPDKDVWAAHVSPAEFLPDSGVDNSPCACLAFNGQSLRCALPQPVTDKALTIRLKIHTDLADAFVRFIFGDETLSWNTFQGYGSIFAKNGNGWHDVQIRIVPQKHYIVTLDNQQVKKEPLAKNAPAIDRFAVFYLTEKKDHPVFIDDVSFEYDNADRTDTPLNENFDNPDKDVWAAHESPAAFLPNGGVDDSPSARIGFNGQSLQCSLPEKVALRPLDITFKIKIDLTDAIVRTMFGNKTITWNTYQGNFDLSSKHPTGWHDIAIHIQPHPIKGGTYTISMDGSRLLEAPLGNGTLPTDRFGIIYLTNKQDKPAFIDNLSFSYGEPLNLPPCETVQVEFPPAETLTFHKADFDVTCKLDGPVNELQNLRLALYLNTGNFHKNARPAPALTVPLELAADGRSATAQLHNVPFGMFTARVLADDSDGKAHVLREEFIAHTHPAPRTPDVYPIRWAMDCCAENPTTFWEKELDALVAAGMNWTRLELNLWCITSPADRLVHLEHIKKVVEAMKKRGIHCFILLNCKPQWNGITPYSNESCLATEEDWAEVCRQVMTEFKDYVTLYEIMNEPQHYNWVHFQPGVINEEQYARLLQVSKKVAASISPDIQVMGPCLTANMNGWIRTVAEAHGFDGVKYFSVHTNEFPDYRTPFYLEEVKKLTGQDMIPVTTEGSNDLRRLIASFAGEINAAAFGYTVYDRGTNPLNTEDNLGMVKLSGMPKARHIAYTWCATMLNHATYIGRIFLDEGLSGYLFKENGVYRAAVFAQRSNKLPKLATAPGVRIYDLLGNPFAGDSLQVIKPGTSVYDLAEPEFIAYLDNLPADADEVLAAEVNCTATYQKFTSGNGQELDFVFTNSSDETRTYQLSLNNAHGISFGKPLSVTVKPGESITKGMEFNPSDRTPFKEVYFDGTVKVNGKSISREFGPIRVTVQQRFKTTTLWSGGDKQNPLYWPRGKQVDIHKDHSTGLQRKEQDQTAATRGSDASIVSVPGVNHPVTQCHYYFKRPASNWQYSIWLASRYRFKTPIPCPGIPLKLTMRMHMEDNVKHYPLVFMYTFEDPTGKEIYIEGTNLFFTGWRDNECFLPSLITHGRLTDAHGGNRLRVIDAYPLKLTGIIVHLIPITSSTHAPADLPFVAGDLLFDSLQLDYYDSEH